jgi:AcrR family transcriptional regulator
MSPRPYRGEQRRAAAEETRARIIAAARSLLTAASGSEFSVDSVARNAGVARMTVYYQFGSKRGLLEAIFDNLAAGGLADSLPPAFGQPKTLDALDALIRAFVRFWSSERLAIRRLRALADLDPVIGESLTARDERRREGLRVLVQRSDAGERTEDSLDETVDMLHTLTSFETFDSLAGETRSADDVAGMISELAKKVLGPNAEGNR